VISILDYGAGNLRSVQNTLAELGAEFELIHDSEDYAKPARSFFRVSAISDR